MEFASRVRPAGRFADRAVVEQGVETGVGICLQYAFELGQVCLGMDALAVGRVGKPNGRRRRVASWPVIAHIGPQARRLGFAIAGRQHRDRRVVGVQLRCCQHMAPNGVDQRAQQRAGGADPARQQRAIEVDTFAGVNDGLAVQRQQ